MVSTTIDVGWLSDRARMSLDSVKAAYFHGVAYPSSIVQSCSKEIGTSSERRHCSLANK
jgi:hypothetical protein